MIYDENLKVTLITSTENAWKILEELDLETVKNMSHVSYNLQDEVDKLIIGAIDCIHEITMNYHEKHCPHICLALGKDFCREFYKNESCKYLGQILFSHEIDDEKMAKVHEVISIEWIEEI